MKKILLSIIFVIQVIFADTYYVATSGKDSNSGYDGSPWLTIQHAHDNMAAGDSVIVLAGTYTERVRITTDNLTFLAESFSTYSDGGFWLDADYITVKGFDVTNATAADGKGNSEREEATGFYVDNIKGCVVDGNNIHDTTLQGIYIRSESDSCQFLNNTIIWCGFAGMFVSGTDHYIFNNDISHILSHTLNLTGTSGDADGFRFFGSGHVFKSNYVHDIYHTDFVEGSEGTNADAHIDCAQTWKTASNIVFDGNIFHNPNPGGELEAQVFMIEQKTAPVGNITIVNNILISDYAIINITNKGTQDDIEGIKIYNNTFYGTEFWAITLRGCLGSEVKNNSFYDCGGNNNRESLRWFDDDGDPSYGNPDLKYEPDYDYNSHYMTVGAPDGNPESNDIWDEDPQCIDVGSLNFRLRSTSPLINKGITIESVTTDFDGVARPNGIFLDIGAFEYDSLFVPPTTDPNRFALNGNYPNPFNPGTTIQFTVEKGSLATLTIFNALGQKVIILFKDKIISSNKISEVYWDGKNEAGKSIASGIYFYQLRSGGKVSSKQMLLLK